MTRKNHLFRNVLRGAALLLAMTILRAQAVRPPTSPGDPHGLMEASAATTQDLAAAQAQTQPARKMLVGINLDQIQYWTYGVFADCGRQFNSFTASPDSPTIPPTLDANGWPLSAAQAISSMLGRPAGVYNFSFTGTNVTIGFGGLWQSTTMNPDGLSGSLNFVPSPNVLLLNISPVDPTKPMALTSFHMWQPGYSAGGPMFLREITASVSGMPLRSMDLTLATYSTEVNWSDRPTVAQWSWTKGVPYEVAIEFAVESKCRDYASNCPVAATADYLFKWADLHHNLLPAGVRWIPEYSNECWNSSGAFTGYPYVDNLANVANPYAYDGTVTNGAWTPTPTTQPLVNDVNTRRFRCAADLSRTMAIQCNIAYADRPRDCAPVICGQAGYYDVLNLGIQYVAAKYGGIPWKYAGVAPYHDPRWNSGQYETPGQPETPTSLLLADQAVIRQVIPPQIAALVATCKAYDLVPDCYEGGSALTPITNPLSPTDPGAIAQASDGMGKNDDAYFAVLKNGGVRLIFVYSYYGSPWSTSNGLWQYQPTTMPSTGPSSSRWAALVRARAN